MLFAIAKDIATAEKPNHLISSSHEVTTKGNYQFIKTKQINENIVLSFCCIFLDIRPSDAFSLSFCYIDSRSCKNDFN